MFGKWFGKKHLCSDGKVLKALKDAGSDLSKSHKIDFWFDFDSVEHARTAAEWLENSGYSVEVTGDPEQELYSCQAVKTMVPELAAMQALTEEFRLLAKRFGGKYDGWGTEVVD